MHITAGPLPNKPQHVQYSSEEDLTQKVHGHIVK
jgi:hypothetical protein